MLVYNAKKSQFVEDMLSNRIEEILQNEIQRKLHRNSPRSEILSWKNSLLYMNQVLSVAKIPDTAGVAIEYNIPLTNRRVDFILTGKQADQTDMAVIIELKQWESVEKTEKDGVVRTFLNGRLRETSHPSYQAWSYAALIEDYNETVRNETIGLHPCAYLHNLKDRDVINAPFYDQHTNNAPVFISPDAEKLAAFLGKFIKLGDSDNIMYRIEHGKIRPSRTLMDNLASMLKGNREFVLLDEQKLVYETALDLAYKAQNGQKEVLIIKGGPGTGKSVVAINLLVELSKREMVVQYATKNSAPREVFKSKLTGSMSKTRIDNLFKGTGSYIGIQPDLFNALIVDEAHRMNEKSGLYGNEGEHQVREVIAASRLSVFFIDEDQRVTFKDIGTIDVIRHLAFEVGAEITEMELASQFRCNGSDGYLAWVDHALQVRETANADLSDIDYDFRVFDNPHDLRQSIFEKNHHSNKARMVAGYCWDWVSKKDASRFDIEFPEYQFQAKWNLNEHGQRWLIMPESVSEIGCIHTCQGLELDYVGVIIGPDFVIRNGQVVTNASNRASTDNSVKGFKKGLKENPDATLKLADRIIKNTYRTLMTRGMKGCYLYCTDKETQEYFASFLQKPALIYLEDQPYPGLNLNVVPFDLVRPYDGFVPIYDIAAAAGEFSPQQTGEDFDWVELPEEFATCQGMFVLRVVGDSMNKRIPNGAWCLFRANPGGTRNGKVVLVQHHCIADPDHGGSYTVKIYHSKKRQEGDILINETVILSPDTTAYGYHDIVIKDDDLQEFKVIGELVAVI